MNSKKLINLLIIALIGLGVIYWLSQKVKPKPSVSTSTKTFSTSFKTSSSKPKNEYQKQILVCLETWKDRDEEAGLLISATMQILDSKQPTTCKLKSLGTLLSSYQEAEPADNYTDVKLTENYQQIQKLTQEWKDAEQKQIQNLKKDWFAPSRWLTDKEIDWALNQLPEDYRFKILPAYQFHYVVEMGYEELGFPQLLNDLAEDNFTELVFIPVNNPDFHWSLLVYKIETKSFWHYDTLRGANDYYIKPLVKDLIIQLWQINESDFDQMHESAYLNTNYKVKQGNGHDCGVAVIELVKRITELGKNFGQNNKQKFDFGKARKEWWEKLDNE